MHRTIQLCLLLALVCAAGCDNTDDKAPLTTPLPDTNEIANDYRHLKLMTPKPVYVDPGLAALCRGVSQADVDLARRKSGPHANTLVSIYMNQLAADAFQKSTAYPVGAIVVKEKRDLGIRATSTTQQTAEPHDGVGGMVKRPPGYDPAHGDWEYFYFEDPAKIETGKIASCVQCHSGASSKDYVFGSWHRDADAR